MLVQLFRSNHRALNIIGSFFVLLLALLSLCYEYPLPQQKNWTNLWGQNIWVNIIVYTLAVSIQAIYLNHIVTKHKILNENTHLPLLSFIILNITCIPYTLVNPFIIINFFLLLFFDQLIQSYNLKHAHSLLFNSGTLLSITSLLYPPMALLLPITWVVVMYIKPFSWRDLAISSIGFCLPLFIVACYIVIANDVKTLNLGTFANLLPIRYSNPFQAKTSFHIFGWIAMVSLPLLLTLRTIGAGTVRIKKIMLVVLTLFFCLSAIGLFFNPNQYKASIILASGPLSILFANFFLVLKRKWMAEIGFLTLLLLIIFDYFL